MSANPKSLHSTNTLLDPIVVPSKDPTGFLGDHPIYTPTRYHMRDCSILPTTQSFMDPSHIPPSVPIFNLYHLPRLLQRLSPYDVTPDLPILGEYLAPTPEASNDTYSIIS